MPSAPRLLLTLPPGSLSRARRRIHAARRWFGYGWRLSSMFAAGW